MKECKCCCVSKSLELFYKAPQCLNGVRPECIECSKKRRAPYRAREDVRARNKAYHARKDVRDRANERRRSKKGKENYWRRAHASPSFALSFALYRALKRCPTKNPISHSELMVMFREQDGCCALTGFEMTWQRGGLKPNSMTMDKIDPKGGYTKDNIRLICHAVNMFRGRMTDAEMLNMARAIVTQADVKFTTVLKQVA